MLKDLSIKVLVVMFLMGMFASVPSCFAATQSSTDKASAEKVVVVDDADDEDDEDDEDEDDEASMNAY